jgi:hypothetical protein
LLVQAAAAAATADKKWYLLAFAGAGHALPRNQTAPLRVVKIIMI